MVKIISQTNFKIADFEVLVSRKTVKNLRLKVGHKHGEIKLTTPYIATDKEIESILNKNLEWINKYYNKHQHKHR